MALARSRGAHPSAAAALVIAVCSVNSERVAQASRWWRPGDVLTIALDRNFVS